jgi:transposase-like protein
MSEEPPPDRWKCRKCLITFVIGEPSNFVVNTPKGGARYRCPDCRLRFWEAMKRNAGYVTLGMDTRP